MGYGIDDMKVFYLIIQKYQCKYMTIRGTFFGHQYQRKYIIDQYFHVLKNVKQFTMN